MYRKDRRIRLMSLAVVAMGGLALTAPGAAAAAPIPGCAVCTMASSCPSDEDRAYDCSVACGSAIAAICHFPVADDVVCLGAGNWTRSWYCGSAA